jgi:hypothetical protein
MVKYAIQLVCAVVLDNQLAFAIGAVLNLDACPQFFDQVIL